MGNVTTKIENYNHAKWVAQKVASAVNVALGRDGPSNDKHSARASFGKLSNAPFAPMGIWVDMAYGYYGSSSGYSATSDEMGRYLVKAINKHMTLLLDEAVAFAAEDAELARKEAEDEARSVLRETA